MSKTVHSLRSFRLRPFIILLFMFLACMLHVMPAQAQQKQITPAPKKIASTAPAKKPVPAAKNGLVPAGKKELTPSSKVVKVAIIDHLRLRQEFKRLRATSTTLNENYAAKKTVYEKSLKLLGSPADKRLQTESLQGNNHPTKLNKENEMQRTLLEKQFREDGKKLHQKRLTQLQEFEKEILQAINKTLAEGGFTELQPYRKDYANLRAINITDLVLKKLN